jgi:putative ATPase
MLGMPECNVHLAQAAIYLATAPKSRAVDSAYAAAKDDIKLMPNAPVPMHIRNAPTKLMKELGYGRGDGEFLPKGLEGRRYWNPQVE